MDKTSIIIYILCVLLFISILNQCWLLRYIYSIKSNINKINYFDVNLNKWENIEIKTFSYIYPKLWKSDRCYTENCSLTSNLVSEKLIAFHNELTNLAKNKVYILNNEYNTAPINLSINDQNIISNININ